MKYSISNEALKDIEEIWLFTKENWSVDQADRYYNLLLNKIEHLTKFPLTGLDYSHLREGYYCSQVKSHLIFYKLSTIENEIEIIRILHQQMDIQKNLNNK